MRVLSWFRRFWGVVLIVLVVVAAVVVQQHTSSHGLPGGDAGLVVRQAGEATSSTLTVTADGGGTRSVSYDHPGVVLQTTLAPGAVRAREHPAPEQQRAVGHLQRHDPRGQSGCDCGDHRAEGRRLHHQ